MKLKTILFFAIVGLIVSAPMLFRNAAPDNGQSAWQPNGSSHTWQPYAPSNSGQPFGGQATTPQVKKPGFLSRLFGGGNDNVSPANNANSPFQFAGSQTTANPPAAPVSTIGNNTSTAPPVITGPASFSQPVYHAFANFNEFLRFDISPNWVKSRWTRVSTFPGEDNLTGMRVALVSGPRPVDIHGSLTYFFDNQQRVQRIGFKGWTGDASELARYVEQSGFQRRNTNGAALFTRSSWGKPKGALRLDHPPVSTNELPNEQLMVLFELINPASSYSISNQTQTILNAMENRH